MKQLFFVLLVLLASCKNVKKSEITPIDKTLENEVTQAEQPHPGKKIMETECYICHNPKVSETSMIAPPMIAIKKRYINSDITKKEFTESLILWINDPEAPSKMPGAQERFGKMPYLPYPEQTITQIAEYIYDYEIEKPKWFDIHYEKEHGKRKGKGMGNYKNRTSEKPENNIVDIGLGYALATKATLGKNLIRTINDKGTVAAIQFCNTEAMKLTDSMSVMKNAIIKRVSDKPRNLKNKANEEELEYLNYYKKVVVSGGDVEPVAISENGKINFYYPITTNTMCLQCHGKTKEQIRPATLAVLKNLYPLDKAVNYNVNEVRGVWTISFDEEVVE